MGNKESRISEKEKKEKNTSISFWNPYKDLEAIASNSEHGRTNLLTFNPRL
jgi:hypothetical protein